MSSILILASIAHGYGQHIHDTGSTYYCHAVRLVAVSEFFAVTAVALSKTSIAITLLRLANKRWQVILIWGVAVSVNIFMWCTAIFLWTTIWNAELEEVCSIGKHISLWEFTILSCGN